MIVHRHGLPDRCHRHLAGFLSVGSVLRVRKRRKRFGRRMSTVAAGSANVHFKYIQIPSSHAHAHIEPERVVFCLLLITTAVTLHPILLYCRSYWPHLFSLHFQEQEGEGEGEKEEKEKKNARREVFVADDEHALTFFPFSRSGFSSLALLHSAISMSHKAPFPPSWSEREMRACRVENFIERDDDDDNGSASRGEGITITYIMLAYHH